MTEDEMLKQVPMELQLNIHKIGRSEVARWVEVYNEDGSVYGGYWDFGVFQCSDDFLKKLEQHPVIRGNCFTGVWIDDALGVEEKLLSKLRETLDAPKKQHKPKQNIPFWVQDWRSKK